MKKIVLTIIATIDIIVAGTSFASAQDYKSSIGLSLGGNMGVNAKFKVSNASAIETGIDYTMRHNAVNLFAVWQYHLSLAEGLYGYAGGGLNIGAQHVGNGNNSSDFNLGLDPNVGIEYHFNDTPIVVGIDYRPSINIVGHSLWSNASVKLRYVF